MIWVLIPGIIVLVFEMGMYSNTLPSPYHIIYSYSIATIILYRALITQGIGPQWQGGVAFLVVSVVLHMSYTGKIQRCNISPRHCSSIIRPRHHCSEDLSLDWPTKYSRDRSEPYPNYGCLDWEWRNLFRDCNCLCSLHSNQLARDTYSHGHHSSSGGTENPFFFLLL